MPEQFVGTALPLDQNGMDEVIDRMKVKAAEVWAILNVETRGCGYLPDRRPLILFERHIFWQCVDRGAADRIGGRGGGLCLPVFDHFLNLMI